MKSLEIVNKGINEVENYGGACGYEIRGKDLQTIKQDLEVLEILKVLILHNGKSVGYKGIIRDFEVMLRLGKITKEQLDKLKQWLEDNQNDR